MAPKRASNRRSAKTRWGQASWVSTQLDTSRSARSPCLQDPRRRRQAVRPRQAHQRIDRLVRRWRWRQSAASMRATRAALMPVRSRARTSTLALGDLAANGLGGLGQGLGVDVDQHQTLELPGQRRQRQVERLPGAQRHRQRRLLHGRRGLLDERRGSSGRAPTSPRGARAGPWRSPATSPGTPAWRTPRGSTRARRSASARHPGRCPRG